MKKILVITLSVLLGAAGVATAAESKDRVAELERQITQMTDSLNALQAEVAALKQDESAKSEKQTSGASSGETSWTDKVALSGQVRFRGYDINNVWDYNDDTDGDSWDTFRTFGTLKATVAATDDVTAVLQITNQTWGNGVTTKYGQELDNTGNKFFLDNAYVNVRNVFDLPVDMTIGRQNLMYGKGFVLYDGNSQFASTSAYLDGLKLSLHPVDGFVLDAFYMQDEENNRDNASHDDISLTGLYATLNDVAVLGKTEIYLLNRHDQTLGKDIWMLGGRVSDKLANGVDYSLEAAIQTGDALENVDQKAWGGKFGAGYTFADSGMTPRIFGEYAYLSGDDPDTADNEGWDVFYGGWGGQFGDLLAWAYVNLPGESNVLNTIYDHDKLSSTYLEAPFSNLKMATLGVSANLMKSLSSSLSYSNLTFDETYAGIDNDFGDYYQLSMKYSYNKQLSFSFYGALLAPGDAFRLTGQDDATEVYWETDYKF